MKNWVIRFVLCAAFMVSLAGVVNAQASGRKGGSGSDLNPNSNIPGYVLHEVLTLAAPHFGMPPAQFIRLFYTCNCISVVQMSPTTYRVVYGGIGIQIVIDATRQGTPRRGALVD